MKTKITGNSLQKGRNSGNKFDTIIEVGRYYNYSIKDITKEIYKQLKLLGLY